MGKTFLAENEIKRTNKYPGTEGHYIDEKALSSVQSSLNPNMYSYKQKGEISSLGVVNVHDVEDLHKLWG